MSTAPGDIAALKKNNELFASPEITVESLIQRVLDGQKSLHDDLKVLRPSLEGGEEKDDQNLLALTLTGESDQLNESIAEVKEAVFSCGENWRKHVSKLARGILVIHLVRLRFSSQFSFITLETRLRGEVAAILENLCTSPYPYPYPYPYQSSSYFYRYQSSSSSHPLPLIPLLLLLASGI